MSRIGRKLFPEKRAFQRSVLQWYATHHRNLPWREDQDPYRILISEFMLQQTRVETVIPYFRRFLKLFPTLEALAKASPQRILKAWAGLGYYARARNLHATAKTIFRKHDGTIPSTREELLRLPGLGPYTAGAVASLAFNHPVPALDGNVKRVITRLLQDGNHSAGVPSKEEMEKRLGDLIPPGQASRFNQALMDLGALICLPARPRCSQCPVGHFCLSRGMVRKEKSSPRKTREEEWAVALVEKEGRFFIHRNDEKGLLGGLWQFPTLVLERNEEMGEKGAIRKFLRADFGLKIRVKSILPGLEVFFTHIHAIMKPYLCSLSEMEPGIKSLDSVRWVRPSSLSRYPVSTAMCRIAALLKNLPTD